MGFLLCLRLFRFSRNLFKNSYWGMIPCDLYNSVFIQRQPVVQCPYHFFHSKTFVGRKDDNPEVHHVRYLRFVSETIPLLQIFKKADLLFEINSDKQVEAVTAEALDIVEEYSTLRAPFVPVVFRDGLQHRNLSKRTGQMRRFVYAMTTNTKKLAELVKFFDIYGIEVWYS